MTKKFLPENEIEELLLKAQEKDIDFKFFIERFLDSEIAVPSGHEVMPDGSGLTPLLFDKNSTQMLGAFTSLSRAKIYKEKKSFRVRS